MSINFRNTEFKGVAARLDQCPSDDMPEIVMTGRSNVGKSSLINALAGQNKLARISNTPGKTRMVIYFLVDQLFYLTDLPGYGFANVSRQIQAEFSALVDQYLSAGRPITMVLHLMDIRHKPNPQDIQMIQWLTASNIPWEIVLTKCDKLSRQQMNRQAELIMKSAGMSGDKKPLLFSAPSKLGLQQLRNTIAGAFGQEAADND